MNIPATIPADPLPVLIDRATAALQSARTSAEVLEARDMARVAYDAAKSAARMSKAKTAHDTIIADVHRAQAHALAIRARAEMRLAEEYDAAQERGEVAKLGWESGVDKSNTTTAADLGLRRDEIHEARKFRDAEAANPGAIDRAIGGLIERGEEPTRAALKREVIDRPQPKQINSNALWLWGRVRDFDRLGVLSEDPSDLLSEMTDQMRADLRRLLPSIRILIEELELQA